MTNGADQGVFMQYPTIDLDGKQGSIDVTLERVQKWEQVFTKVDVKQKLRELELWAEDNPGKRKTPLMAMHHLTQCMERQQRRAELEQYSTAPFGSYVPLGATKRGPAARSVRMCVGIPAGVPCGNEALLFSTGSEGDLCRECADRLHDKIKAGRAAVRSLPSLSESLKKFKKEQQHE